MTNKQWQKIREALENMELLDPVYLAVWKRTGDEKQARDAVVFLAKQMASVSPQE